MKAWRPRGGVRAVSFDLDYTLWDLADVIHRAEQRQYDFLVGRCPEVSRRYTLEQFRELRTQVHDDSPDIRHDVTALRKQALYRLGAVCGFDDEVAEQAFHVFLDARHEVALYPDTKPLLDALHGRYVLGALTNGNAEVARLGLEHYFDFALSAVEVGAAKPDRVIFEAAQHRAGVPAAQIMHVGDEPSSDVVGAARYGMIAVWLNREHAPWPDGLDRVEHIELDSLAALGELLEAWPSP